MKVVCDSHIPFIKGVLEPYAQVVYLPGGSITPDDVRDADALIVRTRTRCDSALLQDSKVKFIATATIGYDHIDTVWCESHGIAWTNAPGCNSGSVRQYIASLLVYMAHDFDFSIKEKTLGVIGVGNVGSKVAQIAALLGFRILLCDPPRARREGPGGFCDLKTIISQSDIITCHVPLTLDGPDPTYHMFDATRIKSMRPDQILINSSRGEVVHGNALKDALWNGHIKAASLDVWENEPDIDRELMDLLYTATPHIAGYSLDGKANGTMMAVNTLGKYFDLPCQNWIVNDIPAPAQPVEFTVDATGKTPRQVLEEAILYTYDIKQDDKRLRLSPNTFEQQRSDYPVRREFHAFTANITNDASGRAAMFVRETGFNLNL